MPEYMVGVRCTCGTHIETRELGPGVRAPVGAAPALAWKRLLQGGEGERRQHKTKSGAPHLSSNVWEVTDNPRTTSHAHIQPRVRHL